MSDSFLLHEDDMLNDTHFPVICFFGVISNSDRFLRIIDHLSNGVGYGYEFASCTFPDDLDDYDIAQGLMFDGVEFALHNGESVVLSYKEFYWYLKKACENYLKKYPSESDTIQLILRRVRKKYTITE